MSNLKHLDVENCVYFITSCIQERHRVFASATYAQIVMDSIVYGRENHWYYLLGFVVMPSHIHLAIVPTDRKVPDIIKGIKGFTSREINKLRDIKGKLWQDGYRDFAMDNRKAIIQKLLYIEENPVRAFLVVKPEDYPFSSAGRRDLLDLSYLS